MLHNLAWLWVALFAVSTTTIHCKTNSKDVAALNNMYTSLNSPSELSGWKSSGGDPCGESWIGITCSGSSVTEINLSGMGLTGKLGYQLDSLKSLTFFDLSNNQLQNDIPYQLPTKLRHLDLSQNQFTGVIPYSISMMTDITYLNLGDNQLNNQLSDMFQKLGSLQLLDVSSNQLSGELPQSLKFLKNIKRMHLQNNKLSGSINVLTYLPLEDLNVENNKFTGWIPEELQDINNLQTGGNSWSTSPAPPPPPGTPPLKNASTEKDNKKSIVTGIIIAGIVCASVIAIIIVIAVFKKRSHKHSSHLIEEDIYSERNRSYHSHDSDADSPKEPPKPSSLRRSSVTDCVQSFNDNEFANRLNAKRSTSSRGTPFSFADLQAATANFAAGRLIGEGSIGSVYRAKCADGKVLAVKKINPSYVQGGPPGEFSQIVGNMSKLYHPNIAELVGHCSEQEHILIYDYFRNGSLHDYLHLSDDFSKPLTWNTRVRIALGIARAIEYLHDSCSPSVIHKNIKSPNIFLDTDLNPRLSDYGLATFYQRCSQSLGVGYMAPECTKPIEFTQKSDVFSFGVVMLELLTGRMPFDSAKPKAEQSLARWASPQLHDINAVEQMVDPALRGLYPPKSLSRFADIIALCVQSNPESRPRISEVVQALVQLVQQASTRMREDLGVFGQ